MSEADIQRCHQATGETYVSCSATSYRPDIMECVREDGKKDYINTAQKWYVKDSQPFFDDQGLLVFPGDMVGYSKEPLKKHTYLGPDGNPLR